MLFAEVHNLRPRGLSQLGDMKGRGLFTVLTFHRPAFALQRYRSTSSNLAIRCQMRAPYRPRKMNDLRPLWLFKCFTPNSLRILSVAP